MSGILKPHFLGAVLSLLWLCSCSTMPASSRSRPGNELPAAKATTTATELPAAAPMNQEAGRGGYLVVMLRLESGTNLPFIVDTGSPITCLDQSLEPELGKQLGEGTHWNFGVRHQTHFYAAPELYSGNTPLITGPYISTTDCQQAFAGQSQPVMGILGMDCLQHYCLQLDFEAATVRFLDPTHLNDTGLGKAFPLTFSGEGQELSLEGHRLDWFIRPFIHQGSLIHEKGHDLMVDTGYQTDGGLVSPLFRREVRAEKLRHQEGGVQPHANGDEVWIPTCSWDGATYTNLLVGDGGPNLLNGNGGNSIGLRFLARHLVTLDFPAHTLYLKRIRVGPLPGDEFWEALTSTLATADSAEEFLYAMKGKGRLPGLSKNDHGTLTADLNANATITYPETRVFDVQKNGDSSFYHYQLTRASKDSSWKLEKAWRTDQNGRLLENYPIP
jgi:hypothetical protein